MILLVNEMPNEFSAITASTITPAAK